MACQTRAYSIWLPLFLERVRRRPCSAAGSWKWRACGTSDVDLVVGDADLAKMGVVERHDHPVSLCTSPMRIRPRGNRTDMSLDREDQPAACRLLCASQFRRNSVPMTRWRPSGK